MKFSTIIENICPQSKLTSFFAYEKLLKEGAEQTDNIDEADVVYIHPCKLVFSRSKDLLEKLKKENKKVVVQQCYDKRDFDGMKNVVFSSYDETIKEREGFKSFDAARGSVLLNIGRGCDRNCTYCPITKGKKISSRPMDYILNDIKDAKRIYLSADDCASYEYGLVELLERIPKDKRITLSYVYPAYLLKNKEYFIENADRIKFDILSIQSGSKRILKLMNRGDYDPAELIDLKDKLDFNVLHFIYGYPTETTEDFMESVTVANDMGVKNVGWFEYNIYDGTESKRRYGDKKSDHLSFMRDYVTKVMDQKIHHRADFGILPGQIVMFNKDGLIVEEKIISRRF